MILKGTPEYPNWEVDSYNKIVDNLFILSYKNSC